MNDLNPKHDPAKGGEDPTSAVQAPETLPADLRAHESTEPSDRPTAAAAAPAVRRRNVQISMRTLLLLTACVATWGFTYLNRRQLGTIDARIKAMRPLAHELTVNEPSKITVVKLDEQMYDEQIWHIQIPQHAQVAIHLATRNIAAITDALPANDPDASYVSSPLAPGRHTIELRSVRKGEDWLTQVSVDDVPQLTVTEPNSWMSTYGSSGGGNFSTQAELEVGKPLILFGRRFMYAGKNNSGQLPIEPSNGVLVWIQ
jgi:hypothetical protein